MGTEIQLGGPDMLTIAIILALLVIIACATIAGFLFWALVKMSQSEGFGDIADWEDIDDETAGHLDM